MTSPYLSELELFVMAAVVRLGADGYGAAIRRDIEERAARPVNIGTIYVTLARLEERGLITSEVARPEATGRGARSRRYCRPTRAGLRSLRDTASAVDRVVADLDLTGMLEESP